MRRVTLLTLLAVLSLPSASYGACVKYQGHVSCENGGQGFTDSSGNVWLRDHKGRDGVIINMDETRGTEGGSRKTVYPDGSFTIE